MPTVTHTATTEEIPNLPGRPHFRLRITFTTTYSDSNGQCEGTVVTVDRQVLSDDTWSAWTQIINQTFDCERLRVATNGRDTITLRGEEERVLYLPRGSSTLVVSYLYRCLYVYEVDEDGANTNFFYGFIYDEDSSTLTVRKYEEGTISSSVLWEENLILSADKNRRQKPKIKPFYYLDMLGGLYLYNGAGVDLPIDRKVEDFELLSSNFMIIHYQSGGSRLVGTLPGGKQIQRTGIKRTYKIGETITYVDQNDILWRLDAKGKDGVLAVKVKKIVVPKDLSLLSAGPKKKSKVS